MRFIDINKNRLLTFNECEKPVIGNDECLINVKSIGVNRADLLQREGKYSPPFGESLILGIEVAGIVGEIGANVRNVQCGDRVCAIVPGGGYAEQVKVKGNHLIRLPQAMPYTLGAAIAEAFLTAYQALFVIAQLKKNQQVLVHAGASGVGTAAIQLCKAIGANVTVTVGSEVKAKACLSLGAKHAINYRDCDFVQWQKDHIKGGFDVILDFVAGDYVNKNIQVCAQDASIVTLAILGGRFAENVDIAKMLMKRVKIVASTLRNRSDNYKEKLVNDFTDKFMPFIDRGEITPLIYQSFDWQDVEHAHELLMNNKNIGKVVLTLT